MVDNKLALTKKLWDLRQQATNKTFERDPDIFKDIESVKAQIKALDKKS